jgi:hypothetical protein
MSVHPIERRFDELQLTLNSAEIQFLGVSVSEVISLSCQISSLPAYNCSVILNSVLSADANIGEISFKADKPIASAELDLEDASFEKLKSLMQKPPARPASIFLKVVKSPNISSGEVLMPRQNFAFQVCDIAIRYPIL